MSALPEPTIPAEDLPPQDDAEGGEIVRLEDVLTFVRAEAARRDPALAHHYAQMRPGRIKAAADLAQHILAAHLELRRRQGRGARTGRRLHAQQVYALLDSTNTANLVLAQAFLEVACILPVSESHRDS